MSQREWTALEFLLNEPEIVEWLESEPADAENADDRNGDER
jgi:hypothetical protein